MKRGMQFTTRMESMDSGVRQAPPSSSSGKNAQERKERGNDIRKPLTGRDAIALGESGRDLDQRAFLELARTVPANRTPLRRNIRRAELRQLVPLADTTIYEMERRGEFPHRFWLTERCVVWDLAEVEAWIDARRKVGVTGSMTKVAKPDVRQRRSRPVGGNL